MVGSALANCWLTVVPRCTTVRNVGLPVQLANKGPTVLQWLAAQNPVQRRFKLESFQYLPFPKHIPLLPFPNGFTHCQWWANNLCYMGNVPTIYNKSSEKCMHSLAYIAAGGGHTYYTWLKFDCKIKLLLPKNDDCTIFFKFQNNKINHLTRAMD